MSLLIGISAADDVCKYYLFRVCRAAATGRWGCLSIAAWGLIFFIALESLRGADNFLFTCLTAVRVSSFEEVVKCRNCFICSAFHNSDRQTSSSSLISYDLLRYRSVVCVWIHVDDRKLIELIHMAHRHGANSVVNCHSFHKYAWGVCDDFSLMLQYSTAWTM